MQDPNEWKRWLAQADYDLTAAQHNQAGGFYALTCFLAQQAAEKALKAYLYGQGERSVLGHSVAELCGRCAKVDVAFGSVAALAAKLDRFYIPTRYPNGLPGGVPAESYDAEDAEFALTAAMRVLEAVRERLPK